MAERYRVPQDYSLNPSRTQLIEQQRHTGFPAECLRAVDNLSVKQVPSLREAILGISSEAKFNIFDKNGQQILQAIETSTFCQRLCCATRRGFTLHIIDNRGQEVILIRREFKCCSGCCWCANAKCCSQEIIVESPPGTSIGSVSQLKSGCRMHYAIKDAHGSPMLYIIGPVCACDGVLSCCCENKYTLFGSDRTTEIGAIHKVYRGFLAEAYTSADAYTLQFPIDLDVKMKAVALGALFLIEFMTFAKVPQQNNS